MKLVHSKSGCFRSVEAGNTPSLIPKAMVWNLQTKILIVLFIIVPLPLTGYAESVDSKIQNIMKGNIKKQVKTSLQHKPIVLRTTA